LVILPYQASARSAGNLKMPQLQLPMFPMGVTPITALLAFIKEEGHITYFNGSLPVFSHTEEDTQSFRMITAQFCVNGHTQQMEIVRAFGVTKISVKRSVKRKRSTPPSKNFSHTRVSLNFF
jgi:hypothetical protein